MSRDPGAPVLGLDALFCHGCQLAHLTHLSRHDGCSVCLMEELLGLIRSYARPVWTDKGFV